MDSLRMIAALVLIFNAASSAGVLTIMWATGKVYVFEGNAWVHGLESGIAWASFLFGIWYLFSGLIRRHHGT